MALVDTLKGAMQVAVDHLNDVGTPCVYTPKDTSIPVNVNVMIRELGTLELVGDFRQGDLKVELDSTKLVSVPKRYDTLLIDGLLYTVHSASGAPRRAGDTVFTYKFIIRGG